MQYRVIATFRSRVTGELVSPGSPCPELDAETAARLVGAGCLVEEETAAPAAPDIVATDDGFASANDAAAAAAAVAPTRRGKRRKGS